MEAIVQYRSASGKIYTDAKECALDDIDNLFEAALAGGVSALSNPDFWIELEKLRPYFYGGVPPIHSHQLLSDIQKPVAIQPLFDVSVSSEITPNGEKITVTAEPKNVCSCPSSTKKMCPVNNFLCECCTYCHNRKSNCT